MKPRIMYIECKGGGFTDFVGIDKSASPTGTARIGRVSFSDSGKTLYYAGRKFRSLRGKGYKANFFDVETGEHYWISGCKKNGQDGLYGGCAAEIDEDVREEYWSVIRGRAEPKNQKATRGSKHGR